MTRESRKVKGAAAASDTAVEEQISKTYFDKSMKELKDIILEQSNEIKQLASELKSESLRIDKLEDTVAMLRSTIKTLKSQSNSNSEQAERNAQYSKRNNLIIKNIPPPQPQEKETGDTCLDKVKVALQANGIIVPDGAFDRAHRVGKRQVSEKYGDPQPMIVRFTSWRERTKVYKDRKSGDQPLVMAVDLTKWRSYLLKNIRKLIDTYTDAEFAFADVNCNICIKFKDGFRVVEDMDAARQLCERLGGAKDEEDDDDENSDDES